MTGDALLCCDGSDGWRLTLRRLAPQRLKVMLTPQDVWADGSLVSGLERLVEAAFARRTALEEPLLPAHPFKGFFAAPYPFAGGVRGWGSTAGRFGFSGA